VIFAAFLALQTITVLAIIDFQKRQLSAAEIEQLFRSAGENGTLLAIATFVTTIICCGLIVGIIKLKKGSVLAEYLCVKSVSLGTMLKWTALLGGLIALSDLITNALGRPIVPEFMSTVYATARPVWIIWLALVVAAPLFEETFFRGFVFKGFESGFMGPIGAVLATTGLWAAIHIQYDAYGIATVFCLGLLLGTARAMTGSLLVPLGLHATANLVATIETAVLR
jgi:membrane protease YdiL (CAAX protease family)